MLNRRKFLLSSLSVSLGLTLPGTKVRARGPSPVNIRTGSNIILSTWDHGLPANEKAVETLDSGGTLLDAVEAGVRVPEADPEVKSVGYGGLPDMDGNVTLDACIMDHLGNAGSVACLKDIKHPVSVARMVMTETPHVMLVGEGALKFALSKGFTRENLLIESSRKAWEDHKSKNNKEAGISGSHDTIGMVALGTSGELAGACTTSGIGMKMPGRVGDSPIIGAGLFVDSEVGAASATGHGELVMKTLGSFLVVEFMRMGYSPEEACREALVRINDKIPLEKHHQVGFIALDRTGQAAGYGLRKGFEYALHANGKNRLFKAPALQ